MTKNKEKLILILLLFWLLKNTSYNYNVSNNYEIVMEDDCFARYSKGRVFIGSKEYIESLIDIDENDILIIDNRDRDDPNMKILSSYKINDYRTRDEILKIIFEYEKKNPSSWKRTISSMKLEWFVHNVLYYLNYETKRTRDVDLNNNDEKKYSKRLNFLKEKKILKLK